MTAQPKIEAKLSRARTQLLLNQPFFGTLCLRLKLQATTSFPTMATDGRRLIYNPAFVERLTPAELEGVLAHEVMHCALAHHCRRGERAARLWNRAADYAINPILIASGMSLPKDALIDSQFADLGAEEIYAQLSKQKPGSFVAQGQPPSKGQSGDSGAGDHGAGEGSAQASSDLTQPVPPSAQPRWLEENGIEPKCLIYLTDLCCDSFPETPEYPVLWVTDSRKSAPFGETLHVCHRLAIQTANCRRWNLHLSAQTGRRKLKM